MRLTRHLTTFATMLVLAGASPALAQFTPGALVVAQYGDGLAPLASTGTPIFLRQFTLAGGVAGPDLPLPTLGSGMNRALLGNGTATSEGYLFRSLNGLFLTIAGYDTTVGGPTSSASPATVNRVAGRVAFDFTIDTTTALSDVSGNIRSAVSVDGSQFWLTSSSVGVRYAPLGAATSTQLASSPTNLRTAKLALGELFISSATGTFQGISQVGSGMPTTSGQTITLLPGFPTSSGPDPWDFWFADPATLYVADGRTTAAGGIQKWLFNGTTWSLAYTLNAGLGAGVRGLIGTVESGVATLYATTTESNANRLVTVTDTGPSATFTTLATAPTNTVFRGVTFAPIPAPGTVVLAAAGLILAWRRRR